jgi:hypothetical protein
VARRRIRIVGGPEVGDPADAVAVVGDGDDQQAFVAAEDMVVEHRTQYPRGGGDVTANGPSGVLRRYPGHRRSIARERLARVLSAIRRP